ncbi:MAG TPA: Lrp/AsnC family transcriptional regulator [Nitrolancea sp.]|nr:Lrp/AsnC family transcriptional regulator [Nitrolancea sp.]
MNDDQSRRRARQLQPDELDRQIIRMLRADGRRSNREIARRLDVPEATARYRVRRLIESGVLNITASVEPEHLGYAMTSVVSVQVEPERINDVAAEIASMPEVMWAAIMAGAHDVLIMASFRDQDEMYCFITDRLARIPGTMRTETSVALRIVKRPHQWATDLTSWIETDLQVVDND